MPDATAPASAATTGASAPATEADREGAFLGMVAAGVLADFTGMALDAADAPDVASRLALTRMAAARAQALAAVERAAADRSVDLAPSAAPFLALLGGVDDRTVGDDWWERLVKSYVASGLVHDLNRALAGGVAPSLRAAVEGALDEGEHAAWVVDVLAPVLAVEPQLAARLALWGRRVAGEALSLARDVVRARPALVPGTADDAVAALLAAMTGGHARRMGLLGLTA